MYGATESYVPNGVTESYVQKSYYNYRESLAAIENDNNQKTKNCCDNTIDCIVSKAFDINQDIALTVRKLHPFRCRSPICEHTVACGLMGIVASAICWIPGTVLWSCAPSVVAVEVGQSLVGIGACTTCLATCCGGPATVAADEPDILYESY